MPCPEDVGTVQATLRRRILHAFQRRGWLERGDRLEMEPWRHGGGFSLDASVGIAGGDLRPVNPEGLIPPEVLS